MTRAKTPPPYPRLHAVEYVRPERFRLSFVVWGAIEVKELQVRGATQAAHVVDYGMGLDVGDRRPFREYSAPYLYTLRGRWLRKRGDHKHIKRDNLDAYRE